MMKMVYYGDEIGMIDHDGISWDDTQDLQACSMDPSDYNEFSKDPQRTPFQWDDSNFAGFSNVKPWIEVHPNYRELNLKQQQDWQQADYERSYYGSYLHLSSLDMHLKPHRFLMNSQVLLLLFPSNVADLLLINIGKNDSTVNLDEFFPSEDFFKPSPRNLEVRYATSKEFKIR